ncbi:MAG: cupin domain-containing protein [Myxococcota bacterium]
MSEDAPLNGDLSQRVAVDTTRLAWTASPSGQVERKRLHRVGPQESGQVTSLVRYLPGASFPEHDHPEGEEIFVLEGVFSDQLGHGTVGMHLLNPEGHRHTPFSEEGCLILVKLRQYDGEGRPYRRTETLEMDWSPTDRAGVEEKVLFDEPAFPDRTVLERWQPGTGSADRTFAGGAELFVIRGELEDADGVHGPGSWLRVPASAPLALTARSEAEIYLKTDGVAALLSV